MSRPLRILITGATGFIGRNLLSMLVADGEPSAPGDPLAFAAQLLGRDPPPEPQAARQIAQPRSEREIRGPARAAGRGDQGARHQRRHAADAARESARRQLDSRRYR